MDSALPASGSPLARPMIELRRIGTRLRAVPMAQQERQRDAVELLGGEGERAMRGVGDDVELAPLDPGVQVFRVDDGGYRVSRADRDQGRDGDIAQLVPRV